MMRCWLAMVLVAGCSCVAGGDEATRDARIPDSLKAPQVRESDIVEYFIQAPLDGASKLDRRLQDLGVHGRPILESTPMTDQFVAESEDYFAFRIVDLVWVRSAAGVIPKLLALEADAMVFKVPRVRIEEHVAGRDPSGSIANTPIDGSPAEGVESASKFSRHLTTIRAHDAWGESLTGGGAVLGIIDTGVKLNHHALQAQHRGVIQGVEDHNWRDFAARPPAVEPVDAQGHGTESLGAAVGGLCTDGDRSAPVGVAPGTTWIACRLAVGHDDVGADRFLKCLDWMWSPTRLDGTGADPDQSPHVINYSGHFDDLNRKFSKKMTEALDRIEEAGILFVHSVGNLDVPCPTSAVCPSVDSLPGTSEDVLTVGGVDESARWYKSGCGGGEAEIEKPDLVAPSLNVRTTTRGPEGKTGTCGTRTGTSLAAPQISGVAALMMQAEPDLLRKPRAVRDAMRVSKKIRINAPNCEGAIATKYVAGDGLVDAYCSVKAAKSQECE